MKTSLKLKSKFIVQIINQNNQTQIKFINYEVLELFHTIQKEEQIKSVKTKYVSNYSLKL